MNDINAVSMGSVIGYTGYGAAVRNCLLRLGDEHRPAAVPIRELGGGEG